MYIPGFNPYLAGDFSQQMGIAPQQTFNEVQAPQMDPSMLQFMSLADFNNLIDSERQMGLPELFGSPYGSMHPSFANTAPIEDVQGLAFRDSYNDTLGISNFVRSDPNASFRLVDGAGNVIYEGVGDDALRQAYTQSRDMSQTGAGKANWTLLKGGQDGNWTPVASDRPEQSALGMYAGIVLPSIAGALLGPALAGLSAGSSATGGAAGAAGAAGATGATAGSLGSALAPIGNIIVSGSSLTPALAGGLAGLGTGALGSMAGMPTGTGTGNLSQLQQPTQQPSPMETVGNPITVTGSPAPATGGAGIPVGGAAAVGGAGALATAGGTPTSGAPAPEGNEILVEAQRQELLRNNAASDLLNVAGPTAAIGGGALAATSGAQTPADAKKPSTLEQIEKYLGLGGGALAILGDLFGGRGRNNANRLVPGGLASGQLNPVFSGGLGAPTLAGAAGNFAPRDVDVDWKRYGYGPEQSFFNYAPVAKPNTSTAFTGYAEGGEVLGGMPMDSYAVRGPGTGRSDEIPALLSDGEYVIDAETVALLGDGSTEAGAERLDQFRVNLRKHKGQQLAKGGFSPDAKAPEHYLKGGRT